MERIKIEKSDNYSLFTELDFNWANVKSTNGKSYWNDEALYLFNSQEIDSIEDATNELHAMCLDFVASEIKEGDYLDYGFNQVQKQLIEESWINNHASLYGRFDFHLNPETKELKLYEYNADTPTSLFEASIVQYEVLYDSWLKKGYDQFNSIHESLVNTFATNFNGFDTIHFSTLFDAPNEDYGNLNYLLRCALESGKEVANVALEDIGYQHETNTFKDLNNDTIECLFKLYPLEYLTLDDFATHLLGNSSIRIIEPFWKLLLSNKLLMAKLWDKHKNHPNLLETYYKKNTLLLKGEFIKKPLLSREGANVTKFNIKDGIEYFTHLSGTDFNEAYDTSNYIMQQFVPQFKHDTHNVVIGSWVVGEAACGIGIREDYLDIIGNNSRFVPHLFK